MLTEKEIFKTINERGARHKHIKRAASIVDSITLIRG